VLAPQARTAYSAIHPPVGDDELMGLLAREHIGERDILGAVILVVDQSVPACQQQAQQSAR
jgi:hypothetical protein